MTLFTKWVSFDLSSCLHFDATKRRYISNNERRQTSKGSTASSHASHSLRFYGQMRTTLSVTVTNPLEVSNKPKIRLVKFNCGFFFLLNSKLYFFMQRRLQKCCASKKREVSCVVPKFTATKLVKEENKQNLNCKSVKNESIQRIAQNDAFCLCFKPRICSHKAIKKKKSKMSDVFIIFRRNINVFIGLEPNVTTNDVATVRSSPVYSLQSPN